jgi:DNA-binding LytR/AlgR family response regulator
MGTIKIGIVEDEIIISETIAMALEELQYKVSGVVGTYKDAIVMLENTNPDLVLLDINLGTKKDGIDLAFEIQKRFNTPIIFLTANSDPATISRAKEVNPLAFLVKPFSKNDLYSAIEIGLNNFNTILNTERNPPKHIALKVGVAFEKVVLDDIVYLKNDHHYFDIQLTCGKLIVVRYTSSQIIALLPANQFVKINRFYIINVKQVTNIHKKNLIISQLTIPISKEVRETVLQKI